MKKIKIGQIGIGHNHGEAKMQAVRKFPELFEVIGYAEIILNKEKVSEVELIASTGVEMLYIPTFLDNFKMLIKSIFH